MTQHEETVKIAVDWAALGTTIATLAGFLPAVAALFTIIWTGIRIYEYIKNKKHIE